MNINLNNSLHGHSNVAEDNADITEHNLVEGLPAIQVGDSEEWAVWVIKNQVVYTAFTKVDTHILTIVDTLKVLADVADEVDDIPKSPQIHLVLDLLIDYSIPVLPNKNFLVTILKQKDSYQKIMDKAIDELRTNDDAFWHPHLDGVISFSEECLFDHDEILTGIIDKDGMVQCCEVMGKLDVENKSSEVHNVQLGLKHPQKIESYSLHKCAKSGRKRFSKDGILNFTPGMNKFTVAKYICNPFQCAMPFEFTPIIKVDEGSKTVRVKFTLKNKPVAGVNLKVTDFCVNISFPKYLSSSSLASNDEKTESFIFNEKDNTGVWKVGALKPDVEYEIIGSFHLSPRFINAEEDLDVVATIDFNIQSYIISGAHVENIKLRDKANPIDVIRGLKSTTHVQNLEMRIQVEN